MKPVSVIACFVASGFLIVSCAPRLPVAPTTTARHSGETIYQDQCARCHGERGEGVAGKHDETLYGERSIDSLSGLIARTMPEDRDRKLPSAQARLVAEYIHGAFYSPAARSRNNPPKVDFARLTNRQYRESVADLIGSFRTVKQATKGGGLHAEYYQSEGMNKKKTKVLERTDRSVSFDFGEGSPTNGITADQFSIAWNGSLRAPDTGLYEFRITTPNGARLYLNTDLAAGDSNQRDDSDAKRQPTLIDLWVSSGGMVRESVAQVFLLGGRTYPLRLDYFKFKEKTAAVKFEWKPPHGLWEVVPSDSLSTERSSMVSVVTTFFPPDDASVGYERGTSVSKAWHEATTKAAVEAAAQLEARLDLLAGVNDKTTNRVERLKEFSANFAERAFRRPLTPELRQTFVESLFAGVLERPTAGSTGYQPVPQGYQPGGTGAAPAVSSVVISQDVPSAVPVGRLPTGAGESPAPPNLQARLGIAPEVAVKRSAMLVLTSPRFLYPDPPGPVDDYAVAARLALAMWDSLPDTALREAAERGEVHTREQVRAQAARMMQDPRTHAKLGEFFHHWLAYEVADDINKDPKAFPDFNPVVLADLRTSLEKFVEHVVWSESSDYRQLLQADYLFLNDRLAKFYGATGPGDGDFALVKFDPSQRAGIFTHPFLLSAFSYHKSTSPIHRGVFLTRNVLGRFLKPPPMAIEFMDDRFDPSLTMREKVTELTSKDACMGCHVTINPLGFSLENYDAVGRFRTMDNNKPVNAESDYIAPDGQVVRLRGARDLAEHAVTSADARRGFVRQLFQQTVKQAPVAYGPDTLQQLDASFVESGYHIRKLLVEVAITSALHAATTQIAFTP